MTRAILLSVAMAMVSSTAYADAEPPVITHVRVANAPINKEIVVRARIEDASEIFAPSVYVRAVGDQDFDNVPMTKVENGYEARIPAERVNRAIEYFIEAFDEQGNGPARDGSPEDPIRVLVFDPSDGPPPPPPLEGDPNLKAKTNQTTSGGIATKWWFWTLIGVAVVGATTAIVVTSLPGSVDSVDIMVQAPDPTTRL